MSLFRIKLHVSSRFILCVSHKIRRPHRLRHQSQTTYQRLRSPLKPLKVKRHHLKLKKVLSYTILLIINLTKCVFQKICLPCQLPSQWTFQHVSCLDPLVHLIYFSYTCLFWYLWVNNKRHKVILVTLWLDS